MNNTGYPSSPFEVGVGGSMKAFFLLILVFAGIIVLASTSLSNVDLTPDTPAEISVPVTGESTTVVDGYNIVSIQDDSAASTGQTAALIPGTGTCANPYTIRQGDSLSSIALLCDTSMAEIRLANPDIVNANLIYAGQQVNIPGAAAASNAIPVPITSGGINAPQVSANSLTAQGTAASIISPGTGVQVTGIDFPANTPVYFAIGPENTGYTIAASGVTDALGRVSTSLIVPVAPNPNEPWVIVVATSNAPIIQAASQPFLIQP